MSAVPPTERPSDKRRFGISIIIKTLLLLLPLIFIFVATVSWYTTTKDEERQGLELRQSLETFVALQAQILSSVLWNLDTETLDSLFRSYSFDSNIRTVVLFSPKGDIIRSIGPTDLDGMEPRLQARQTIVAESRGKTENLGTLAVAFSDDRLREVSFRRYRDNIAIAGGLALVIAITIIVVLRNQVGLPLKRLLISMDRAASERIREPVVWGSRDELGRVVAAYNAVLLREAEAQAKLEAHSGHLEEVVAQRTKELMQDRDHLAKTLSQLADREDYLHTIFDTAGVGIVVTGADGTIREINDDAAIFLALERDAIIGNPITSFLHPDDCGLAEDQIRQIVSRNIERFSIEARFLRNLTEVRWAALSVGAMRDERNQVVRLICSVADVTELKRGQERFRALIQSAPDPMVITDTDGKIALINLMAEQLFGYSQDEMADQNAAELFPARMRPMFSDLLQGCTVKDALRPAEAARELTVRTRRGMEIPVEIAINPIETEQGIYVVSTLRDVTLKRKALEEIERARVIAEEGNRAKSEFLANMSHEIRTPMNAILGLLHLTLNTEVTTRQRGFLTKMQNAAQTLLGVINDVLDFSKIEAGKMNLDTVTFGLDEVFEAVSSSLAVKAEEKGLNLLFFIDPAAPTLLRGDAQRLTQVIMNLASNAVKFTDTGEVKVSCELETAEAQSARLRFSVTDTGIGMTEEESGRIFDAFSQADASITRRYGGTGLGLAISRRLVRMMGGNIELSSRKGVGTTFWFSIGLGLASQAEHIDRGFFADLPVAVVGDNATSRGIVAGYLRSFGCLVREIAADRPDAAAAAGQCRLVVADRHSGGGEVMTVARAIRASAAADPPKILALTAQASEAEGCDGSLVHPVSPSSLMDVVLRLFAAQSTVKRHATATTVPQFDGHVLLVEDNDLNQHVATELLQETGVRVTVAENGRECLERLEDGPVDLILMDIQMPVMDGYAATSAIRKDPRWASLPVVAMTANAMAADRQSAIAVGMDDHLAKPVNIAQLHAILSRWLRPRASGRAAAALPPAPAPLSPPATLLHFDVDAGVSNSGGNAKLYWQLLERFARQAESVVGELRRQLADNDREAAIRGVHTLKSTAATVGAQSIRAAALRLEQQWRNDQWAEWEAELDALAQVIQPAAAELAEVLSRSVAAAPKPAPTGRDPAKLLPNLIRLIGEQDTEALALAEELVGAVNGGPLEAAARKLVSALSEYDFDKARDLADRIIASPDMAANQGAEA